MFKTPRLRRWGWIASLVATMALPFESHSQSQSETMTRAKGSGAKSAAKGARGDGVAAVVATDGALVFASPDASSAIIAQLPEGQKVRVSKGVVKGPEEQFRRIRVGPKIGYIITTDVALEGATAAAPAKAPRFGSKKRKNADQKKRERDLMPKKKKPMYFTRYIGLLYGDSEYKEGISGINASTSFPTYGFKITGPDVLISGPVIDFNFALHYGAPSYYDKYASARPTGFVIFTDALALVPFFERMNSLLYVAGGPALVYSQFNMIHSGKTVNLSTLNLGLSFALGGAYRIDRVALRLEGKYMVEKQSYRAIQAAVQIEF